MTKSSEPHVEANGEALAALTEDKLRLLLLQMFDSMGFQDVFHHHGGALEQGKDITMWKAGDLGERVNYAVVVKRGDVTGKVAGKGGAGDMETQVRQCFGTPFKDKLTSADQDVHQCWVLASGKIPKEALHAIQSSLQRSNLLAQTRFIDGDKLGELVAAYLPERTLLNLVKQVRQLATEVDQSYDISLGISKDQTTLGFVPKSESLDPLALQFDCAFASDPEGLRARQEFEAFLKTGTPFRIKPPQLKKLHLPEVMRKLVGDPEHRMFGFEFTPQVGEPVPCRVEAHTDGGESARLDLIELRRIRAGTEELLLSNEQQVSPIVIQIKINFVDQRLNIHFKSRCCGHNVGLVAEWFRFQRILSQPAVVTIEQIVTRIEVTRHRTNAIFDKPDEAVCEMAEALAFIQRKTGTHFTWPEMISAPDQTNIINVANAVESGRMFLGFLPVTVPPDTFGKLFGDGSTSAPITGQISSDYQTRILDVPVNLGPVTVHCQSAQICLTEAVREDPDSRAVGGHYQAVIKAAADAYLEVTFARWG